MVLGLDEEFSALFNILPYEYSVFFEDESKADKLVEVVLDIGRIPFARYPHKEVDLSRNLVTKEILAEIVKKVGTFNKDDRAGIEKTLHRISCIRNRSDQIIGLTCRVGRPVRGNTNLIEPFAEQGNSILIIGHPGAGKTSVLRELARVLSVDHEFRVLVVDTNNEIGGDGDTPHPAIGRARRMMVKQPNLQHIAMVQAVKNHTPQIVIIDEISTKAEVEAANTIAKRGIQLIATAHSTDLRSLIENPDLVGLLGGIQSVTVGDDTAKARGTKKTVLEREFPPTFQTVVEQHDYEKFYVHGDVQSSIDAILSDINGDSINQEITDFERLATFQIGKRAKPSNHGRRR